MTATSGFDRCLTFIKCQVKPADRLAGARETERKLAVTLCRQAGAGGLIVAEKLAAYLQQYAPRPGCEWTVFDNNLVEKALEEHHLPKKLAQFMPEDRIPQIDDMMQELLGLHPPSWTLVRQMTETILKLAELGNVILVGRGANVVTSKMPHVFHARLVGSLEQRARRVQEYLKVDRRHALEYLDKEDRGRERYVRTHYRANIEDPLLYHVVVNTDRVTLDDAAVMIGEAALRACVQLGGMRA